MSGYGVPQGPTPGSPRSAKSSPALPILELVGVGLAVLAFIIAFLPWAKPDLPDGATEAASANGWQLPLPTVVTVLLLVAAVLVAAPLLTKSEDSTVSPVPALLADIAAVLAIVYVIVGASLFGAVDLTRGIGSWLGLVLALGVAATLTVSWLQRSGRIAKPAPAGPSNWQQGQPQGWGQPPSYGQQPPSYGQQPPAYGQQPPQQPPAYGGGGAYGGPPTGGQPAQPPYGQPEQPPQQYPPQSGGGYPPQTGGYHPQG